MDMLRRASFGSSRLLGLRRSDLACGLEHGFARWRGCVASLRPWPGWPSPARRPRGTRARTARLRGARRLLGALVARAAEFFVAPGNDASVGAEWGESHTASGDLAYHDRLPPNATADGAAVRGYACDVYETTATPTTRARRGAERLDLGDDRVVRVDLADWLPAGAPVAAFSFYGANYTALRVSANGHVTFEGAAEPVAEHQRPGDKWDWLRSSGGDYAENVYDHFDAPRVAALSDDLVDELDDAGLPSSWRADYSVHGGGVFVDVLDATDAARRCHVGRPRGVEAGSAREPCARRARVALGRDSARRARELALSPAPGITTRCTTAPCCSGARSRAATTFRSCSTSAAATSS